MDTKVYPGPTYTKDDLPIHLEPRGGGGTSFIPAFEHWDAEGDDPACAIYLTDGYGDAPEVAPDYPVLWVLLNSKCKQPATWGECLYLKEDL